MDLSHLILRMFAKSPHEGLSVHMNRSCECVVLLPDFFTKVFSGDWSAVMAIKQKINGLESDADGLKKKVYMDLHSNLMLPVSRQDVLGLLKSQDSIANQTQDIAGIVYGRRMVVPKEMQTPLATFVASSVETCLKARDVVGEMESAIQDSFSKRSQTVIKKKVEELDALEHDNDMLQIELRDSLWQQEKNLSAVEVMFLYEVFGRVGSLADNAHHVGAKLMLMLAGK